MAMVTKFCVSLTEVPKDAYAVKLNDGYRWYTGVHIVRLRDIWPMHQIFQYVANVGWQEVRQ